jgi:hypothetical protein
MIDRNTRSQRRSRPSRLIYRPEVIWLPRCVFGGRSITGSLPGSRNRKPFYLPLLCRPATRRFPFLVVNRCATHAGTFRRLRKNQPFGCRWRMLIGPRVPVDDRGTPHAIRPIARADSVVGNDVELVGLSSGVARKTRMWYTFVLPRLRQLAVSQR